MSKENLNTVESRYLEFDVTILYKFKLPEVQISLHFGQFGLVKKVSNAKLWLEKAIKIYF